MKKWFIFGGGVLTGIALTFLFAFMAMYQEKNGHGTLIGNSEDDGITWFEKAGDTIEVRSFKVFQVISAGAALAHGQYHELDVYTGAVYLLTNTDSKYYYDDEIVNVPDGKSDRRLHSRHD